MFCRECGAFMDDSQTVCPACGAGQEGGKKKKGKGKGILIAVIVLILLAAIGAGAYFLISHNSPEAKTLRFIAQGEQCLADKEYKDAVSAFEDALEVTPDSLDAYKGIVDAYLGMDKADKLPDVYEDASDDLGKSDLKELRAYIFDTVESLIKKAMKKDDRDLADEYVSMLFDIDEDMAADIMNKYLPVYDDPGVQPVVDVPPVDVPPVTVVTDPQSLEDANMTLTLWCIATEADSTRRSYELAIEDLARQYPNITLNWEAYENQSYKTKIKAAVAANEMPDIFFTWSGAFLQDFVNAGAVYCLDDVYRDYASELPESMLYNSTYYGSHYGVPLTMNVVTLFANMEMLEEAGYDEIPGTFSEFVECCDALKEEGIIPFGCAGRETWCVTEYLEPIMIKTIGAYSLHNLFLGYTSWDDDGIASSVDLLQELIENGYFDPDGYLSNDEVKSNFIDGKYAFYMNGSWNCADFAYNCTFEVGVGEFPVVDPYYGEPGTFIGGPSDTLAVSANCLYPELTAQYAFELGKRISNYGYIDGCGLSTWRVYMDDSNLNTISRQVQEMCNDAESFVLFGDTIMNADDAGTYLEYISEVYFGMIDGDGFIDGLARDIR